MTTPWEPEPEESTKLFTEADWDAMSITQRVARARSSGRRGQLGAKLWVDLAPDERASIIDPEAHPVKLEYQIKAHVVLEDSVKEDWGMVKYVEPGTYVLEAAEGELIGNWSKSPTDGLIHVFLETPLQALLDKATQHFAEHAARRKEQPTEKKAKRARAPKTPEPEPGPSEDEVKLANVRRLLGK